MDDIKRIVALRTAADARVVSVIIIAVIIRDEFGAMVLSRTQARLTAAITISIFIGHFANVSL